jgi:hypothetical protein
MKGYFFKNLVVALAGIIVSAAVVYYLVIPIEAAILQELVSPESGTTVEEWATGFSGLQSGVIVACEVVALIWLLLGLIDPGRRGSLRRWWMGFGLIAVLLGLVACIWLPQAQSGVVYAVLLSVLNAALLYWLATAWWTSATHKYDPLGSEMLRVRLPW